MIKPLFAFLISSVLCACPFHAAAGVVISEFMADNSGTISDQDGASPDWIEIHNDSAVPVNLASWHLTDSSADLTRWTFPATNLPAGGYLIVFASGKNRAAAGAELHTNFQLGNGGSYLALVQPDGVTVAHEFSPAYPVQRRNVSYGLELQTSVTQLISASATARVLVPSNSTLGLTWTARTFADSSWAVTNTPVGFAVGIVASPVLALDINERGQDAAATTQAGFTSFVINSNGGSATIQTQATTRVFGGMTVTVSNTAPYGYDDRLRATPVSNGAFTESLLLRDFIFSRDDTGTGGLDVSVTGLAPNQAHRFTIWSFDTSSTGNRVSDWSANGTPMVANYTFSGANLPVSNEQYRFSFDASTDGSGKILLSGRRDPASATFGVFLNALKIEALSSQPATNGLAALMLSKNASAFIRIPFTVADPNAFQMLKLRMRYDDGFVAYINGQFVASRNAPASPQWNSSATNAHSDMLVYEDILLANSPGLLVSGANVLAIHGMNVNAADPDFLILPELQGIVGGAYVPRYFTPATPGADNGSGYLGLASDTKFSVDRGFYDTPFTVAITSATATASIYWTTNGSIPSPTNGTLYTSPIPIANTKPLRAAAFLTNHVPSEPDTHTYIFLSQVLQQPNSLPGYPTVWQASYPADYEMDPNVVNDPNYGATISNDMRSIPTLSIITDHASIWDPSMGIYVDATQSGDLWERAASVELFDGDNTSEFQANCGLRMEGNASRDNVRLCKHSFRLIFRSDYGPAKLSYNWFGNPVAQFDNIDLRACFTDAWGTRYSDQTLIPGGKGTRYRPEDSIYMRDVWVKDSLRDMGHLSGRGDFVHLYINGLYWGIYNPTERLDASNFAEHLGGLESDWDVIRDVAEVLDGNKNDWSAMIALCNAGIISESAYQAVGQLVDIEDLIDYMLLHIYAEAEDWPSHNWYAAHRRANSTNGLPATKWIFLPWDQEIVLDQLVINDRINSSDNDTPARIYSQLRAWPEFRRLFGDRIQKHLFNGGALTPSNNAARLMARAARIDRAIVGESARWGDAREFTIGANPGTGITFTRDEWWVPELDKLRTNHFSILHARNLTRFTSAGLYPTIGPPSFNQFGGDVPAGFTLVMTHSNATGIVFYTLDGSDPRVYGSGAVAPTALAYGTPVPINQPLVVRARVRSGSNWSALVETSFAPPQDVSKLVLTEIMYNPPPLGQFAANDLEFLELKNVGTNVLNLSGFAFGTGITFSFTNGTLLAPGQFFVLARNATAFAAKYPGVPIQGVYGGQLNNGGEALTLSFPGGGNVFSVTYGDLAPWPITPNGLGFSLVPKQPGLAQAPDDGAKWRASALVGGSPGADDLAPNIAPIIVNEILTHTDPPLKDSIELYNPTTTNVNVGGWYLTDDPDAPKKYRIPDGTFVVAGGYRYFDESQFNTNLNGNVPFAFTSTGESVYLFSALTNGQLTGYTHGFAFGAVFNGVNLGRFVNSVGEEFWPLEISGTLGLPNSGPRIGPIVINEIHYHPLTNGDEFIELLNTSNGPVRLYDPVNPTNTWKVGGLGYTFPTNITLGPHELLLLVPIDPAVFRANYSVPASVQILGPVAGSLQNDGERLTLEAPDTPNLDAVPYVTLEEVRYNDKSPWPPGADGSGASLQRLSAVTFGSDPVNWIAAVPTPGHFSENEDSDGDGLPDAWEIEHGTNWKTPDAGADPDHDGMNNWQEFLAGTDPLNSSSSLRVDAFLTSPGSVTLQFLAISNRNYSVLYQDLLGEPDWFTLVQVEAHGTNRIETVVDSTGILESRFYRLVTPQ
jgi:hypothetical protein